ncbi:MAG: c-type cytochrome [Azospirillum sp.]|nr:c-type cytochrome [Azospirillum sp.]
MEERLTRNAARNIFYGSTAVCLTIFVALVAQSHWYMVNSSTAKSPLTESVAEGKRIWTERACANCHTILGEGSYFAPELGNVWLRYGGDTDAQAARDGLKGWFQAQPSGVEGRRQMPQFHLSDQEMDEVIDFLKWTSEINTQSWPPNLAG